MVISHNMLALNANRQFNIINKNKAKSTEKLSSGYRINRAADDAAGLSISEKMRRQIRGLSQGVRNTEDGVSLCQVADGALAEVTEMLHRITELSVQSANGTNTDEDRKAIQQEIGQILNEIDKISDNTQFNTMNIFGGADAVDNNISSAPIDITQATTPANTVGNTVKSGGMIDIGTITTPELYISTKEVVRLTGTNSNLKIICDSGSSIILDNIRMANVSDTTIELQGDNNQIALVGDSYISSSFDAVTTNTNALVHIGYGTSVTFEGDGSLNVTQTGPHNEAAAIGGNANEKAGNIYCNLIHYEEQADGTFIGTPGRIEGANMDGSGAGIGGGINADGGLLVINNGAVCGTSVMGAGFGGGANGNGGTVILNGGMTHATIRKNLSSAGNSGAAIGGGVNGNGGTMIYNGGTLGVHIDNGYVTSAQGIGAGAGGSLSGIFENNTNLAITPTNQTIWENAPDIINNIPGMGSGNNNQNTGIVGAVNHVDGKWWIQSGSEAGQGMFLEIDRMNTSILGINDLDVSTVDGANHAINAVHGSLEKVSSNRSKIGAQQNRLEHTIANEQNVVENTTSAESRIRDTDMSKEMVAFSKDMILENVGQAMLAQANQSNQGVLSLLQ